jgi:hypothetical protein
MRIALLLSGLTRSASLCYDNLNKFLLSKHDVDIYIHTWNVSNVSLNGVKYESETRIDDIKKLYNPIEIVAEDYFSKKNWLNEKYSNYNKKPGCYPDRTISMFYKIEQCFNLVKDKYDFYIRSRIDLLINEEIDFTKLDQSSINIPKFQTDRTGYSENDLIFSIPPDSYGITDCISIGTYDYMRKYCSIFSNLDKLCIGMGFDYHPEYLTLKNIETLNMKINRFDLNFYIVRKLNK